MAGVLFRLGRDTPIVGHNRKPPALRMVSTCGLQIGWVGAEWQLSRLIASTTSPHTKHVRRRWRGAHRNKPWPTTVYTTGGPRCPIRSRDRDRPS